MMCQESNGGVLAAETYHKPTNSTGNAVMEAGTGLLAEQQPLMLVVWFPLSSSSVKIGVVGGGSGFLSACAN
jgi:hypothetical protein